MSAKKSDKSSVVQAAGGLLWRESRLGKQLALVHRPRYDDWSLPKGKLSKKETWEQGALREVREETGCQARLGEFAGCTCYIAFGQPKVVLFWNMELELEGDFQPDNEVGSLEWLTVEKALRRLSHNVERDLVLKNSKI